MQDPAALAVPSASSPLSPDAFWTAITDFHDRFERAKDELVNLFEGDRLGEVKAQLTTYNEQLVQVQQRVTELAAERDAQELLHKLHQAIEESGAYADPKLSDFRLRVLAVLNGGAM